MAAAIFLAGCQRSAPQSAIVSSPTRVAEAPAPPPPPPIRRPPAAVQPAPPDLVLVGLSQSDMRKLLGPPAEQADTGAGQSWTYRGVGCVVRLTFFFDVSRNDFYAIDRSVSGTDGTERAAQRCLRKIQSPVAVR